MAVKDFFDNLNGGARWDVGVSINRSNSLPLDANSVFSSLEAAQNYAAGNPAEGTLANAYPGQVLAVVTDAETVIYYIDAAMTLQPVGNTKDVMAYIGNLPEDTDAETLVAYINEKIASIEDTIGKAADGENAATGLMKEIADIKSAIGKEASEGVEATGLEKKIADVESKIPTKVSALENDSKYQTEDQVKAIISEINHAVFQKVETIPSAETAESNVLYIVPEKDDEGAETGKLNIYAKINNGSTDEMVLIDDTDVDLSGYALKSELHNHSNKDVLDNIDQDKVDAWDEAEKNIIANVSEEFKVTTDEAAGKDRVLEIVKVSQDKISGLKNAAGNDIALADLLATKVDKNGTDRLITEEEAAKLELLVIDEETGQAAISGTVNANQVQGLEDLLNKKVDAVEGMGLSANNFTDDLLTKLNNIEAGAQVNIIEKIKFNGVEATVEDKVAEIALNIADADTIGGVKSVDAILVDGVITNAAAIENKISVANDGTMSVNSLNVNKLVQTEGETLILNGGSATSNF